MFYQSGETSPQIMSNNVLFCFPIYFSDLMKTPLFTADVAIFGITPPISKVIRLGLCRDCAIWPYLNRLTVFSWYGSGETMAKDASVFATENRLNYILYIVSYARRFLVTFVCHTWRKYKRAEAFPLLKHFNCNLKRRLIFLQIGNLLS